MAFNNTSYVMLLCTAKLSTLLVWLVLFTFKQEILSRKVSLGNLNLSYNGIGVYIVTGRLRTQFDLTSQLC